MEGNETQVEEDAADTTEGASRVGRNAEGEQENDGGELPRLMELLAHEDATWEEVENRLQAFPGWLRVVDSLRYPTPNTATRTVYTGSPAQYDLLPAAKRKHLADIFRPYAILLDTRLSPGERAARLRDEAGVDPIRFCREHERDGSAAVAAAAREVLAASRQQATLLRQTASPATPPTQLLRPADADNSDAIPARPSLLQRLFGRRD